MAPIAPGMNMATPDQYHHWIGGFRRGKEHIPGYSGYRGDVREKVGAPPVSLHEPIANVPGTCHIPGAGVYVPNRKMMHGNTYGDMTRGSLLRDADQGKLPGTRVCEREVPPKPSPRGEKPANVEKPCYIPGTTLYQPHQQHIYATTFGNQVKMLSPEKSKPVPEVARDFHDLRPVSRAPAIANTSEGYIPGTQVFVPGLKDTYGQTFGHFTQRDLVTYARKDAPAKPVRVERPPQPEAWKPSYKRDAAVMSRGRIPGYMGYVPGEHHVVGRGFGSTTKDLERTCVPELLERDEAARRGGKTYNEKYLVQILLERLQAHMRKEDGVMQLSRACEKRTTEEDPNLVTVTKFKEALEECGIHATEKVIAELFGVPEEPGKDIGEGFIAYVDAIGAVDEAKHDTVRLVGNATVMDRKQHVPGYGGFLPNTSRQYAVTYGTLTHSDIVNKGDKFEFGEITKDMVPRQLGKINKKKDESELKYSMEHGVGHHLPGYTGHIAHGQLLFGQRYGAVTRRLNHSPRRADTLLDDTIHEKQWTLPGNNEGEGHMSGYCGFVPGYMDSPPGKPYPVVTEKAIFTEEKAPRRQLNCNLRDAVVRGRSTVQLGDRRFWNNNYQTSTMAMTKWAKDKGSTQ
eukprot:Rmarinus@m.4577